jgi:hypothetical protein
MEDKPYFIAKHMKNRRYRHYDSVDELEKDYQRHIDNGRRLTRLFIALARDCPSLDRARKDPKYPRSLFCDITKALCKVNQCPRISERKVPLKHLQANGLLTRN